MGIDRWNIQLRKFERDAEKEILENENLRFPAFLEHKYDSLKRQARYSQSSSAKAHLKRRWRDIKRKYFREREKRGTIRRNRIQNPSLLLYKNKPNALRDHLFPDYDRVFMEIRDRLSTPNASLVVLEDFSFAKNPQKAFDSLLELSARCAVYPDVRLAFVDQDCDDITPYIVLSQLRSALPPIISGGYITHEVGAVVDAVGLRRPLNIGSVKKRRQKNEEYSVKAFKLATRMPPRRFKDEDHLLKPQTKEAVADRFCDTLNKWLREYQLELTPEAEGSFTNAIGEALDNAERHGDPQRPDSTGDWYMAAFSRLEFVESKPLIRCSVGIVSIGSTISESLISAAPTVREKIDEYVSRHSKRMIRKVDKNCLRTVMAIQDGITRIETATEERRGGVGFMELIDVFAELGDNDVDGLDSIFTIISGNVCIRVTSPFAQGIKNKAGLRELWFNNENKSAESPSDDHVYALDTDFPGVILSACFTIDPEYLRRKIETNDEDASDQHP